MQYDNKNRGAAFPKKSDNPKAPQYSGTIDVDGKEYEISIWNKTSKSGNEFLSLSVKEPWKKPEGKKTFTPHNKSKGNGYQPQGDEEIPF